MLYFYYGIDSFRVKEATKKKIASFVAENENGLVEKLDFEKENCLEEIDHILKRRSFFDEPELIMVYAYLSGKDLQKKNSPLFKFLSKNAEESKEFESIKGASLEKWALEKITGAGFKINLPVLKKLISAGLSQERLAQEIEKLMAYQSFHGQQEIDNQSLSKLIQGPPLYVGNFALIDALGARDLKKSVVFLNQALGEGAEPHAILGQIIYQFRNLLRLKSLVKEGKTADQMAKLANLHPFVVQKNSRQAKQFDLEELKKIYQRLSELDIQSKTGQIDLPTGLFQLILEI